MTINCKGKLVDLSKPRVMGILNLTPDSFYDGGKYKDVSKVLLQVEKMLTDGGTFIDIGAYSSRPNAEHVSEQEELHRITPILTVILKEFPDSLVSIDTFRSKVAQECLEIGGAIINDISAGNLDTKMYNVIAKHQVPYIMMHLKGTPQNMASLDNYRNLIKDIIHYFSKQIALAKAKKINDIIIDPGFGFAKNTAQNFELLANFDLFKIFKLPLLVGLSRKSMIYKTLKTTPQYALNGTTALHMTALHNGATILRAHDTKEAKECITLFNALQAEFNS